MRRCVPWLAFLSLLWATANSTRSLTAKPTPTPAAHWISTSGIRHNRACRWFQNTRGGRWGAPDECQPCQICGG
jgi:hypothetical protein